MAPQHVQHEKDQMHHLYKLCEHPLLAPETRSKKKSDKKITRQTSQPTLLTKDNFNKITMEDQIPKEKKGAKENKLLITIYKLG